MRLYATCICARLIDPYCVIGKIRACVHENSREHEDEHHQHHASEEGSEYCSPVVAHATLQLDFFPSS